MSLHEPTEYNEYIGEETVKCEYKEFTFNFTGLILDTKLAEHYCSTNLFDFNKNVIFNLKRYYKAYLGKYACGFFNSGIDGECYIGINDYGFVKGIPFKGRIPAQKLKEKFTKVLNSTIKNHKIPVIDLANLIQVKFIKINPGDKIESKQNSKFLSYMEEKEKYLREHQEFVNKTNAWRLRMNFSLNKLVDLANNPVTRAQLVEYIRQNDPSNPVIKLFESEFQLEYKRHEDIIKIKDDPAEPYHWVTRWKDSVIDSIKAEKPILNSTFNGHNTPYNLLISANEMIPYWLTYNANMNLYVIQIKFFGSKLAKNDLGSKEFMYLDLSTKRWTKCYRTVLSNGEPVCLPF